MGKAFSTNSCQVMGKYSARTTSDEIGEEFGRQCKGKTVIVTGANSGTGFQTARTFAKYGAEVILACRSAEKAQEAMRTINIEFPKAQLLFIRLDLSSFQSIKNFCAKFRRTGRLLHYLVNNAVAPVAPRVLTNNDIENQFQVNHLGHFLLSLELLDIMCFSCSSNMPGRIINVSSFANYLLAPEEGISLRDMSFKQYDMFQCHAASKLANILFTRELARRVEEKQLPILTMSVHPGIVYGTNTFKKFQRESFTGSFLAALLKKRGASHAVKTEPRKTVNQGAATTLYCALAPKEDLKSGAHYNNCMEEQAMLHVVVLNREKMRELWKISLDLTGATDII